MAQKPTNPPQPLWKVAIALGLGAFVGILLGAVLSNLVGGGVPWVPIGAGVGSASGIGISYVLANRRKEP